MAAPPGDGRVLFDLQGTQSVDHRERGIARFVLEHAKAIERLRPGLVGRWLLNPDLQPPGGIEPLVATGRVTAAASCPPVAGGIHHLASPYELSIPLDTLWPRPLRYGGGRMRLVVTLYDLIPEVMADRYLQDPGLRHRYRARHQVVRSADRVLAISRRTASDAIERLGVPPERVVTIGGGVSERFRRPDDPGAARSRLRRLVPGLSDRYVLYQGGMDDRKNIDRLLEAWAALGEGGRRKHRLVIACRMGGGERNHYARMSERLGVEHDVLFPGYTPDDVLVLLYQCADLFVFPSLYEGYGLPVAEALACGAAVIGSSTSSVGELLEPDATFEPSDTGAIAASIDKALGDDDYRRRLAERAEAPARWDDVAALTLDAYDDLLAAPAPARRPRPLVAFATPLPPARTDVARYSTLLLDELADRAEIDVFADGLPDTPGRPEAPAGCSVDPVSALPAADRMRAYDHVVYCVGNSEFHIGSLAALRRREGTVLAHDVRLTGLYRLGVGYPDSVPGGFRAAIERMYDGRVPPGVGVTGFVTPDEADRYGILMAREVVALSERFLTTSEFAAALARVDADPDDADKIEVVPFAMRLPEGWTEGVAPSSAPLVATFGVVNAVKQPEKLLDAFALLAEGHPDARLAFVGAASSDDVLRLRARAAALDLDHAVTVTGEIDGPTYASWLARATVAVQLRASTNGETSGAVGNCLAAGKATVVTAIGSARDLPDDAVVKVAAEVAPEELAATVAGLLDDGGRRDALGAAARRLAGDHTMERAAAALWAALTTPRS